MIFIEVFVVILKGVMIDIVILNLLFWEKICVWVFVCFLSGFVEIFFYYFMEVVVGGGS